MESSGASLGGGGQRSDAAGIQRAPSLYILEEPASKWILGGFYLRFSPSTNKGDTLAAVNPE